MKNKLTEHKSSNLEMRKGQLELTTENAEGNYKNHPHDFYTKSGTWYIFLKALLAVQFQDSESKNTGDNCQKMQVGMNKPTKLNM